MATATTTRTDGCPTPRQRLDGLESTVFEHQDGTPHSGASPPGPEPIGGLPLRVDCELMNQLNVIIGFAELLVESDHLDALHRRYASHIAASGARACAILRAFFK